MTALSTAEAALRRAPDDPAVPVTVSGAEAAALVAELDRLRERGDRMARAADELNRVQRAWPSTWASRGLAAEVQAWRAAR